MSDLNSLLESWNLATADLQYGVQRVFHDVFVLASKGETHLVYGADYSADGYPCLVNTVGTMLTTGGGRGIPSASFPRIVSLFDQINRALEPSGVNDNPGLVSPLAAEVLVKHFAPLKPIPHRDPKAVMAAGDTDLTYVEATDEEMAEHMVALMQGELPPCGGMEYHSEREAFDYAIVIKDEAHPTEPTG